jgi:hypothetical protein
MVWHVGAMDVYYFERDLESHELKFSYNNTQICSDENKIACLYPQIYSPSTSFLSSVYQVVEYRDYLDNSNRKEILNHTNNGNFIVIDSKNQIWYLVQDGGEPKPLVQVSNELGNMQLSILYYTDVLSHFPNAYLYATIAAILTTIAAIFVMILVFICMSKSMCDDISYMPKPFGDNIPCMSKSMYDDIHHGIGYLFKNQYLPWFLWMLYSTLFSAIILNNFVVVKSQMDGWWSSTLISTMANWSSASFIVWITVLTLTKEHKINDEEPDELSEAEINEEPTRLELCIPFLGLIIPLASLLASIMMKSISEIKLV